MASLSTYGPIYPQDDITFPAPLSQVLPDELSEEAICQQEWHLMHDIEVDESMLTFPLSIWYLVVRLPC